MNAGRSRLLLLAVVLGMFAIPSARQASPAGAAATPATIGALRICSKCAEVAGDLSRYHYLVLNSWDAPMIPALKAKNPGLKVLVYKNLSFTVSYGCSGGVDSRYQSTGVGYCDANANHPEWFLTDSSGTRLDSSSFAQAWMMDVGNAAYQSRWSSNVLADLRAGGWDGVFMDDTNTSQSWHLNGRTIAKYPTDAAWRAATRSMLAAVGPALRSAGFLAVPNIAAPWASDYDAQAVYRDWLQFVSGAAQEYYTKWGTGSSSWLANDDWAWRQQFQVITQQAGKIFLGIAYGPSADAHSQRYARANFLLFDDPAAQGALIYEPTDPEAQDPYTSPWATDVGSPLAARFRVGAAWRRNYSGGTVLVNPSLSTVAVALERPYLDERGAQVTSVSLGPTSGALLRSTTTAPTLPPRPSPLSTIQLNATIAPAGVRLHWSGMTSSKTGVWRNGRRVATVKNTGSRLDKLGDRAKGTLTYRVCVPQTTTCSAGVSVTFRANPSLLARYSPAHLKKRAHPLRHATHRHRRAPQRHG